jgi:hypothetical protein
MKHRQGTALPRRIDRPRPRPYHRVGTQPVAALSADSDLGIAVQSRDGGMKGEGSGRVTENERRAADSLRISDLVLRGVGAVGLIAVALVLLLVLNPS